MKYALENNQRVEAKESGKIAQCPICLESVRAHCGEKYVWHWKHLARKTCDFWWESETPWHRNWKNNFPEDWQEVVHRDPETGEKHIADIKNKNGVVVEFQNSYISEEEIYQREEFYKKLIWVVNLAKFKKSIELDPFKDIPEDIKKKINKYEYIIKNKANFIAKELSNLFLGPYMDDMVRFEIDGERTSLNGISDNRILQPLREAFSRRLRVLSAKRKEVDAFIENADSKIDRVQSLPIENNNQSYLRVKNVSNITYDLFDEYHFCEKINVDQPSLLPFDIFRIENRIHFNSIKAEKQKFCLLIENNDFFKEIQYLKEQAESESLKIDERISTTVNEIRKSLIAKLKKKLDGFYSKYLHDKNLKKYSLYWKRPREAWLNSKCSVFFDLGDGYLYYRIKDRFKERYFVIRVTVDDLSLIHI